MYDKALDWETADPHVRLSHHDEHRDTAVGYAHRVRVRDVGSMLELHDRHGAATPHRPGSPTRGMLPTRTALRSGLTETILPVESFREWWEWFSGERTRPIVVVMDVDESVAADHFPWLVDEVAAVRWSGGE